MKNSLSPQQEKLEQLKQLLPEVFTEGRVDWEKLKLSLGEDININNERYVLNWAGKSNAYKVLQEPTSKTLSPDKSESVDFDKTENLFIEGDNLEALKILQKSYFGKVKMIYIDPPYNTGNDSFIYPDRFKENLENYQKNVGDKDEDGYLIQDSIFKKNRKENGQYHSNWLNMMMPRLYLAKNLLRDDGVIFISIDDNEVHNLRLLMNEIFGEENFVACIVWEKVHTRKNSAKYFSVSHEYILLFAKNKLKWNRVLLPRENIEAYKNPDNHQKGPWKLDPITAHNEYNADYIITKPNGVKLSRPQGSYWRFSENTIKEKIKSNEIVWGDGDSYPMVKRFLSEAQDGLVPITIFHRKFAGDTSYSKKEIDNILTLKGIFEYVKPSLLIKRLMQITIKNNDIILDFFAGSGTTAHAVMQLNAEDGGSRKCISIQLPEICEEKSEAFKAGYKTIADIAKERIRRAGKKIKEDNKDKENIDQLDIGFKVLKVSDSNFREWRTDISSEKLDEQLDLHVDPIAEDASTENMVYELMLKNGKDLNSHIKHHNHIYSISDQENHDENILVLLLEEVNEGVIENVLQENPNKVIALDKLFKNNDQLKTNTALQMQDADIKFETI
ncbi:site-specific DNA-methyltransferase [Commensalibacter melissae]|uniref:site-specific DNA-methyltransferase n=2 Tax=Commensalibacter melissae TaxID=2070537 RepID=UPI0012D8A12A|nr:DNA methyltransferase [Commensalibacter melissae]MUG08855.1 site-specific DNA-methyltransferase [Commensalibacter melissae]